MMFQRRQLMISSGAIAGFFAAATTAIAQTKERSQGKAMDDNDIQSIIDQTNIISLINLFYLSVDKREYTVMRTCLTNQIEFDYTALFGTVMPSTADELVENVRDNHKGFRATQHITTNHYVTVNNNTAECVANFQAQHFLPNDRGSNLWTLGGRYTYSLVQTEAGWKIHGCIISVSWTDGNLQLFELAHSS